MSQTLSSDDDLDSIETLPPLSRPILFLGAGTSLLHLFFVLSGTLPDLWMSALHFGCFGLLCALTHPLFKNSDHLFFKALNLTLGFACLLSAVYVVVFEQALYARGVTFNITDWIFSLIAIGLAVEFTRRTTGWIIPLLIILALTYVVWWGAWIGGVFSFAGLSLETLLYRSYFGSDGMFGSIARISWSYVFMFILFGAFLVQSGASQVILNVARAAAGRFRGGPGFVAVLGSGLMGSISGSAVANTVSTGVITIPLMRRSGFSPRFAAGVEAAASTGGQLMPPIMGAGAFIMANFTGLPFTAIITAAALPALLYFLSVAFFVRVEAVRCGLTLEEEKGPSLQTTLKKGWTSLAPIVVLVGCLLWGFTPSYAAAFAILSTIVFSWASPNPLRFNDITNALARGAVTMTGTAVLLVAVGLIVNVVSTTGLGSTFSLMIGEWAGGSLLITLVFVAIASLILGMGLPVTAAYIVLATLSAPALYDLMTQSQLVISLASGSISETAQAIILLGLPDSAASLGAPMSVNEAELLINRLPPDLLSLLREDMLSPAALTAALLSAHMIIFWLSQDSNVTPPVCLAAFSAASIAGTPPMRTGVTAWKIAKGLYLIPLLFAYTPLMSGTWSEILTVTFFAAFGLYGATGVLHGVLEGPLSWAWRIGAGVATGLLLWPHGLLSLSFLGLFLLCAIVWQTRDVKKISPHP